ncbi:hypothetical protein BPT24_180 [Tenacibaculum phage pT24]|uniref:Uncharacterized protein n=1 Tax=Tenacibaculum phage pT24 TaxID=1880590 RepID=A0A1B4XWX3_9CAUD|nr:hypothetical protein HYP10_gp180 [Tenacibaculum phage pT24]BAV39305.1 hypothetical protein BPT24_180 [Tenacibaculum phage pT24]
MKNLSTGMYVKKNGEKSASIEVASFQNGFAILSDGKYLKIDELMRDWMQPSVRLAPDFRTGDELTRGLPSDTDIIQPQQQIPNAPNVNVPISNESGNKTTIIPSQKQIVHEKVVEKVIYKNPLLDGVDQDSPSFSLVSNLMALSKDETVNVDISFQHIFDFNIEKVVKTAKTMGVDPSLVSKIILSTDEGMNVLVGVLTSIIEKIGEE